MRRNVNVWRKLNGDKWTHAAFVLCTTMTIALAAQASALALTFTRVHSFNGTDGSQPNGGLLQATNGNLYGTTFAGGANPGLSNIGAGTVFQIMPNGTLTTVYNFCSEGGSTCTDGDGPEAGLLQTTDGAVYGTTADGGANQHGTVFKITGTLKTIYNFCSVIGNFGNCADGASPSGSLHQGSDGNLYGITSSGGTNQSEFDDGAGTIFKINKTGIFTTLHSFDGTDGASPTAGLTRQVEFFSYGTTLYGGSNPGPSGNGAGTAFAVYLLNGTLKTVYNFCSQGGSACTDGYLPAGKLLQAAGGTTYGTTTSGGANDAGTIFKINTNGTLTTLYNFCSEGGSACTDGAGPEAGLIQASDGSLYGTTAHGGANFGTVFKINPANGVLTTLYSFHGADGMFPDAPLVQATDGDLYGTTQAGGTDGGNGTVFELSGLPPPK